MRRRISLLALCTLSISAVAIGQEMSPGISIPVTISGDVRQSQETNQAASFTPGFRAVLSPSLRFGSRWFAYAALDVHSSSYFPYELGAEDDRTVGVELMQAFIGYVRSSSRSSILIKAGQISSAFGLSPMDYDDFKMPLINPPLAYTAKLPIRADQVPCGVEDIIWQTYDSGVAYHCGGSAAESYGLTPVTLYGLPSVEVQVSLSHFDGRLQITNSSPANPHGLFSGSQRAQWTAGGGYTFAHAFHIGASGFRGPYLDSNLIPSLPRNTRLASFPASGFGIDANWSRDAWSARGEWLHLRFNTPRFIESPSQSAAYFELKRIVSPRIYAAGRLNFEDFGPIEDQSGLTATHSAGPEELYELAIGFRLNRQQLLKVGAGWQHGNAWSSTGAYWPKTESHTFELQLVTSFTAVSKAFQ